jgi:hypothetical protein
LRLGRALEREMTRKLWRYLYLIGLEVERRGNSWSTWTVD